MILEILLFFKIAASGCQVAGGASGCQVADGASAGWNDITVLASYKLLGACGTPIWKDSPSKLHGKKLASLGRPAIVASTGTQLDIDAAHTAPQHGHRNAHQPQDSAERHEDVRGRASRHEYHIRIIHIILVTISPFYDRSIVRMDSVIIPLLFHIPYSIWS